MSSQFQHLPKRILSNSRAASMASLMLHGKHTKKWTRIFYSYYKSYQVVSQDCYFFIIGVALKIMPVSFWRGAQSLPRFEIRKRKRLLSKIANYGYRRQSITPYFYQRCWAEKNDWVYYIRVDETQCKGPKFSSVDITQLTQFYRSMIPWWKSCWWVCYIFQTFLG